MTSARILVQDGEVWILFDEMKIPVLQRQRFQIGSSADLLKKAVGKKLLQKSDCHVVDLTAGLGRDSLHLAGLGLHVVGFERHPLLFQALVAAAQMARVPNLSFLFGEANELLAQLSSAPDIIFYDPMFPEKKKSAASGKESQLLQALSPVEEAGKEHDLAERALEKVRSRLIIKRPLSAPEILPRPQIVFRGKAVRYDVYLRNDKIEV